MTISRIKSRFQKEGYKLVACWSFTNPEVKIIATNPQGYAKRFASYNEAYRYYFAN